MRPEDEAEVFWSGLAGAAKWFFWVYVAAFALAVFRILCERAYERL